LKFFWLCFLAFDLPPSCRTKVMQKVFMFLKAENSDTSCGHVVGIDIS